MLGAQEQLTQLSQEKEIEKKNRVSFEMRLVDFEEYKRHAETDIVSYLLSLVILFRRKISDYTWININRS